MKYAKKFEKLDEYIFYELERKKQKLKEDGMEIIDLSIGDPDMPTPDFIIDEMIVALKSKEYFHYPPYSGIETLKQELSDYYMRKYAVKLDPANEIAILIGSKEGISHLILSLTDKDDTVILPNPAYPVYKAASTIANCNCYIMTLEKDLGYLPNIHNINQDVIDKAKLLIVNYPNNPTGAAANLNFYNELIDFGIQNDIVIVNDGAYLDIVDDIAKSPSILQGKNALEICVEFGTFSKAYNMAGWRLGYVVGNKNIIQQLMKVKTNFDSGQFVAIQKSGIVALRSGDNFIDEINKIYAFRKKIIRDALFSKGINCSVTNSTFYLWFEVPKQYTSTQFSEKLLCETGIMVTPGSVFGDVGEGHCRISVTAPTEKIKYAAEMIKTCEL